MVVTAPVAHQGQHLASVVVARFMGQEWLGKIERMLRKTTRVREEQVTADRQYDLLYADITADWQRAMQGVYDYLDLPFTDQAKDVMQSWLEGNRQHKHGAHRYSLADFGLERDEVDRRLMFYRERFNIPYEDRNPHLAASGQSEETTP